MARLGWSVSSQQDLVEIGDFIARDSALYAIGMVDRIIAAAEGLEANPRLGRVVPEYGRDDLRELIVESHRLVYLIRGDEIIMVRVIHGARDFRRALGPRPWLGA